MSKTANPPRDEDAVVRKLHRREAITDAVLPAAGGIGAAAIGAAMGSIAGPPGAIAGAVIGGAIGAASAAALENVEHERARRDAELDEEIGVTGPELGRPSAPPPPKKP